MNILWERRKRFIIFLIAAAIVCAGSLLAARLVYDHTARTIEANDEHILQTSMLAPKIPQVRALIVQEMKRANIPGLSIAVVHKGETVYRSGFGYADIADKTKAACDTLYELASNSKAFTGLGVLLLEQEGRIEMDKQITSYIPWLDLRYQNRPAAPTVEQFLHHTSGVPSYTISEIKKDDKPGAIERTVRSLVGSELSRKPGSAYEYATINYDVLGLLIEEVTGKTYEQFISEELLTSMGLSQTYAFADFETKQLAQGYKTGFGIPLAYRAPVYDGNKPAGYLVSNVTDMATWLTIQLGTSERSPFDRSLIDSSHTPNLTVEAFGEGMYYAAGWITDAGRTMVVHTGSNPNYSSIVQFLPQEQLGVVMLCNTNSSIAQASAVKVLDMLSEDGGLSQDGMDIHGAIDVIACVLLAAALLCCCVIGYQQLGFWREVTGRLRAPFVSAACIVRVTVIGILAAALCVLIILLPRLLLGGVDWAFVFVWYAVTVRLAVYSMLAAVILGACHLVMLSLFPRVGGRL